MHVPRVRLTFGVRQLRTHLNWRFEEKWYARSGLAKLHLIKPEPREERQTPNAKRTHETGVPILLLRLIQQPIANLHAGSWKAGLV
jgi:hypothetical protein